ncbi:MAG: hypothetical protein HY717_02255 [Planctomycetes bacterium]|nr:hypothetical protein [Planctomycetota bacterium]
MIVGFTPGLQGLSMVKGPYLQNVAADGITICWETDLPASGTVHYGLLGTGEFSASGPPGATLHQIRLGGLAADTGYVYQAEATDGGGTISSAQYDFYTAPASSNVPVRFAAIADTGGPSVLSALASKMLAEAPDLVIHAGDIQYGDPADP